MGAGLWQRGDATGPAVARDTAREVLEEALRAIRQGEDIGPGDVDGLLRHADEDAGPADGLAQILTRRRMVSGARLKSAYIQALDRVDLVFGLGPARTGKTYLAVADAAQCLERGLVHSHRAVAARGGGRPAAGLLPGDMRERVVPVPAPLDDAPLRRAAQAKVERDLETGVIEIAPLAFMRGRTLAHSSVILDEAQNIDQYADEDVSHPHRRRAEDGGDGDPSQIDLPLASARASRRRSGCLPACAASRRSAFTSGDVVRRDLVACIVEAYDRAG